MEEEGESKGKRELDEGEGRKDKGVIRRYEGKGRTREEKRG